MKKFSNFDLQSQEQYYSGKRPVVNAKFMSSGAGVYFREYDYSATYFSDNKEVLIGKTFPLKLIKGIPEDDETTNFYTYYTYAKI